MNFLKKYLTFHLSALFGYYCLGQFISDLINPRKIIKLMDILSGDPLTINAIYMVSFIFFIIFSAYFVLIFTSEVLIKLFIKKTIKKDLSINIQNKYYNIFFYIGLLLTVIFMTPGVIFSILFFLALISLYSNSL